MTDEVVEDEHHDGRRPRRNYQRPTITHLGDLADLTLMPKNVGGADGTTFLGVDLGS
jgi:hypothetical protein